MSNHFPTIPTLELASITYTASFTTGSFNANPTNMAGFAVSGVSVDDVNYGLFYPVSYGSTVQAINLHLTFDTPGIVGSFDQDNTEALVASTMDSIAQAMADAAGTNLATQQAYITVNREWNWLDSTSQFSLTYNDTMTYPS